MTQKILSTALPIYFEDSTTVDDFKEYLQTEYIKELVTIKAMERIMSAITPSAPDISGIYDIKVTKLGEFGYLVVRYSFDNRNSCSKVDLFLFPAIKGISVSHIRPPSEEYFHCYN